MMTYILRSTDRTIKTFSERGDDFLLEPGEILEVSPLSFSDYAHRLTLSCSGISGETLRMKVGTGDLAVKVHCPAQTSIVLDVNGTQIEVVLTDGVGQLMLSTETAGTFKVSPADRTQFAAAGESLLIVEVAE